MKNYALVTGASGGIGLELAKLLAKDKHDLILVARSEDKLNEIKTSFEKDYNSNVSIIAIDLSVPDAPAKVFEQLKKDNISIDVLINNAGFGDYGAFCRMRLAKTRANDKFKYPCLDKTHSFISSYNDQIRVWKNYECSINSSLSTGSTYGCLLRY